MCVLFMCVYEFACVCDCMCVFVCVIVCVFLCVCVCVYMCVKWEEWRGETPFRRHDFREKREKSYKSGGAGITSRCLATQFIKGKYRRK